MADNQDQCRACQGQWPARTHWIADLRLTTAYLFEDQFFPGWTVLVLNRHATELFHLSQTERSQVIEDVSDVSRALYQTFHAVKINYELLGNQLPHIHWHLIPRLLTDPAPTQPVWTIQHQPCLLTNPELAHRIRAIRERVSVLE
jgi:diadenosine tetraphosphate (Ap4A) HIT family hydrolase